MHLFKTAELDEDGRLSIRTSAEILYYEGSLFWRKWAALGYVLPGCRWRMDRLQRNSVRLSKHVAYTLCLWNAGKIVPNYLHCQPTHIFLHAVDGAVCWCFRKGDSVFDRRGAITFHGADRREHTEDCLASEQTARQPGGAAHVRNRRRYVLVTQRPYNKNGIQIS